MTDEPVVDLPLLRFIPFRKADIVAMCLAEGRLTTQQEAQFGQAADKIEDHLQRDFLLVRQRLKSAYAPMDPDADTRVLEEFRHTASPADLAAALEEVLERANYDKVTAQALLQALGASSLFQVRVTVDLDDFAEVLLFTRGASQREVVQRSFFGLRRRHSRFISFDRVLLYLRLKDDVDTESAIGACQPGSTLLKLFQNVPEADLEMLFPNIRVEMRMRDRLLIGIPAVISGGLVVTTKLGGTLLLLGSLFGFWLGLSAEPVELDRATVLVLLTGAGALLAYLWKQFSKFRNRKLKYTQALTENLYFKLLDNNAGVIYRLLEDAEESEGKESLLAYYCLLAAGRPLTMADLDGLIERWFAEKWQCKLDFDIGDALDKLLQLGLVLQVDSSWQATTAEELPMEQEIA